MGTRVTVLGTDLVVEEAWSRHPRVLLDGQELPRDRRGVPVLVDGRTTSAAAPLPTTVRVALLAFVVVGPGEIHDGRRCTEVTARDYSQ